MSPEIETPLTVILSCRQKSYCGGWAVAEAPEHSQQGRAPRAGLNLVFSEERASRFWVTVLFPVQFGAGGRRYPGRSSYPWTSQTFSCPRLLQLKIGSSQYSLCQRRSMLRSPSACWVSRFCRTAGSRLCTPEGLGAGGPPAPHLCPVFSQLELHTGGKPPSYLAILLEWCSFLFLLIHQPRVGTPPS